MQRLYWFVSKKPYCPYLTRYWLVVTYLHFAIFELHILLCSKSMKNFNWVTEFIQVIEDHIFKYSSLWRVREAARVLNNFCSCWFKYECSMYYLFSSSLWQLVLSYELHKNSQSYRRRNCKAFTHCSPSSYWYI